MKSLIRMYLYRLVHSVLFWVCLGLAIASVILTVSIDAEFNVQEVLYSGDKTYSIAGLLVGLENFGNWPVIVGPAFVSFFFALEWKDGTFRNQLLAGKSRTQVYFSAQIVGLIISFGVLAADLLVTLLLGFAVQMPFFIVAQGQTAAGLASSFWIAFFLLFFLGAFITAVATSFAFIIHNAWGAFGCLIGFIFLSSMIYTTTLLFQSLNYDNYYVWNECVYSYQLMTLQSLNFDSLTYGARVAGQYLEVTVTGRTVPLVLKTFFSALLIGGGMGYLGWLSFTKRDLK